MAPFTARGNLIAIASEDSVLTIDSITGVSRHASIPTIPVTTEQQILKADKQADKPAENQTDKPTENQTESLTENQAEKPTPNSNSEDYSHLNLGSCIVFSPCTTLLAVCTPDKNLTIWNVSSLEVVKQCKTARKVSSLTFNSDSSQLFVADKAGDCFCYSLNLPDDKGKLILGHLSMLLDVVVTNDNKFIITCERDEKIRISCLPNAYNIHAFCLGHTEFVTSLAFLHQNLLLSGSGDGTLMVWDYLAGKMLHKEDLRTASDEEMEKAVRSVKVFRATATMTVAAVLLDRVRDVLVFKISGDEPVFQRQTLPFTSQPLEVAFTDDGSLYVLTDDTSNPIEFFVKDSTFQYTLEESAVVSAVLANALQLKIIQDCGYSCNGDLKPLFKRWFDNVHLYRARKLAQIEKSTNSDTTSDPKRLRVE